MFDRRRSREVGQGRHLKLLERLSEHPCCRKKNLRHVIELRPEDRAPERKLTDDELVYKILSRNLTTLVRRGQVKWLGVVPNFDGCGPPESVYGVEAVKQDWLLHEAIGTAIFEALGYPPALRGYDVPAIEVKTDKKVIQVRADGVWLRPGKKDRLLEVDLATEGFKDIARKTTAFKDLGQAVLFVTVSEARRRKLMRWTKPLELAFFALWRDVVRNPWGLVWLDRAGKTVAMTP